MLHLRQVFEAEEQTSREVILGYHLQPRSPNGFLPAVGQVVPFDCRCGHQVLDDLPRDGQRYLLWTPGLYDQLDKILWPHEDFDL